MPYIVVLNAVHVFLDYHTYVNSGGIKFSDRIFGASSAVEHVGRHSQQFLVANTDHSVGQWRYGNLVGDFAVNLVPNMDVCVDDHILHVIAMATLLRRHPRYSARIPRLSED